MANSPYKTLGNIRVAVVNDVKESSTAALVTQVNRWINEGYEQVILAKKREWLDTQFVTQLQSSTQAVCTVTNGSPTVTFASGTTFPSSSTERIFYNTGFNEIYNVSSNSGLNLTLANSYLGETNTAAAGIVAIKSILLDPSIREVYKVYHQWAADPLTFVGPQQFREIVEAGNQNLDYAQYCTIFGQDNTSEAKRLLLYPYPDQAYTLYYDANVYVTPLSADGDEPIMPMQHRQILYHFAMYKLYSYHRNDPKAAEYLNNFNTMLARLDGESKPQQDFPQLQVRYPRGRRLGFFPTFDTRYRE